MAATNPKTVGSNSIITVHRHPFDSREARYLIPLLEADLAAFYPDWDQLVHPGMHHENNPRPPAKAELRQHQQADEHEDAKPLQANYPQSDGGYESESSGLYFFVAFASDFSTRTSSQSPKAIKEAIGCGALRLLPSPGKVLPPELDPAFKYAEVKRMYVHPECRGYGVSKEILAEMELCAREMLKLDVVVVETGSRQKAAVGLYIGAGYVEREMFGEYVGSDPASGGDSICMEKRLK